MQKTQFYFCTENLYLETEAWSNRMIIYSKTNNIKKHMNIFLYFQYNISNKGKIIRKF